MATLLFVGGVDVEEKSFAAALSNFIRDPFRFGKSCLSVQMDAADVHAATTKFDCAGRTEPAGSTQDHGPLAF